MEMLPKYHKHFQEANDPDYACANAYSWFNVDRKGGKTNLLQKAYIMELFKGMVSIFPKVVRNPVHYKLLLTIEPNSSYNGRRKRVEGLC